MKRACFLLLTLLFFALPVNALFRAPKCARTEQPAAATEQNHVHSDQHVLSISPFGEKHRSRGPRLNPVDRYNVTTPGSFSLACAILGLVCLAGAGITSFSLLMIPVFIFATLAAVFGAIGINRHKPGYAITGMVLGMLEIVGGFIMLAMVL